jgi:hypothetical protein
MGSPKAVLLADLLKESNAAARLIDITEAPDGHWFSLRVEIAGAVAKDLVLPKSLVLGARTDPKALRTLRNIMRVEVTMQRSRDAIDRSREILAGIERDSICPRCSKLIPPGESERFKHGEVFHIRCEP